MGYCKSIVKINDMPINLSIFRAYDIRGEYPHEFNEEAAYAVARAAAQFLKVKRVVLASDNRSSSPQLKEAALRGLVDEGKSVIDMGVSTSPMFYFAVNRAKADGGIIITASHNPPQYNGMKIVGKQAQAIGEKNGLLKIRDIALGGKFKNKKAKPVAAHNFLEEYSAFLISDKYATDMKIVADASCGTTGMVLEAIAQKLRVHLMPLCFAPCRELAHGQDPLKDENVQDLKEMVVAQHAAFGVAFDPDGDRAFFFDEKGERMPAYVIGSLLAAHVLHSTQKETVIADVRMPQGFAETVKKHGGTVAESKVGHVFIKELMRKKSAIFGAEVSGHFYFRDFFYADSGIYAMMQVLDILAHAHQPVSEVVRPFFARFQSSELNFKVADSAKALKALASAFHSGKQRARDGLSVHFRDWWFNARPSNTEPYLRVNIEAETDETLREAKEKIEKLISGL